VSQQSSDVTLLRSSQQVQTRTAINPKKSIELIKASLYQKLDTVLQASLKLFKTLEQDSGLLGSDYDDLVFMCNFHRMYEDNIFKTVGLLEDIFKEYQ
jgi:hypothetical protein